MILRSAIADIKERLNDADFAREYGGEMAKTDFAITLFKARKQANLTQKELADQLGRSQAYIAKLEGGEANPTLESIGQILAVLGLRLVTQTAPLAPADLPSSPKQSGLTDRPKPAKYRTGSNLSVVAEPEQTYKSRQS